MKIASEPGPKLSTLSWEIEALPFLGFNVSISKTNEVAPWTVQL